MLATCVTQPIDMIKVRIRLSRFGCKNKPFYRVMAANSRSLRDEKHLEVLGYYNLFPGQDGGKRMGLNFERVKYWLSIGAQPSKPVQRILYKAGVLPPPLMVAMGCKGGPRDMRSVDLMTGRVLNVEKPGTANQQKSLILRNAWTWLPLYKLKRVLLHLTLSLLADEKEHL